MAEPSKDALFEVVGTLLANSYPNNQSDKHIEKAIDYARKIWKLVDQHHGQGGWG